MTLDGALGDSEPRGDLPVTVTAGEVRGMAGLRGVGRRPVPGAARRVGRPLVARPPRDSLRDRPRPAPAAGRQRLRRLTQMRRGANDGPIPRAIMGEAARASTAGSRLWPIGSTSATATSCSSTASSSTTPASNGAGPRDVVIQPLDPRIVDRRVRLTEIKRVFRDVGEPGMRRRACGPAAPARVSTTSTRASVDRQPAHPHEGAAGQVKCSASARKTPRLPE